MRTVMPDYKNCIADLACSVLKYFGVEPPNPTLPLADGLFDREYKNVVLLLLDGMGRAILESNLKEDGFFRRHLVGSCLSTFPPTTVAATTAVQTGLYPNQSAWLGWEGYFPQIDKNVIYFRNTDQQGNIAAPFDVANTFCPYRSVVDILKENGIGAYNVSPYDDPPYPTLDDVLQGISDLCATDGRKYIYAYWPEPDSTMHEQGCYSDKAKEVLGDIERRVEEMAASLQDTLLIITADHGQIDTKAALIGDIPSLAECLVRPPSIEARALNFFIKDGKQAEFESLFNSAYGDKFILMPKSEVLRKQLFGIGKDHPNLSGMLGDYLAVAVSDLTLFTYEWQKELFKGVHAGMTADEMIIPIISFKR